MGVFADIGVRPIINVAGTATRLGGGLMPAEVVEAMAQAAADSVALVEAQAAASKIIADVTGAEAGYVTSGAAAGLTLGTAACIAGLDIRKMDALPNTADMPCEVVIAREQRSGYDHAIRAAGAKLVEVGMNEVWSGAGVRTAEPWEYEAAITENTVAVAYVVRPGGRPRLDAVAALAGKHDLPVLVDAAGQLPPVENLRRFIDDGADLVSFSGGKALRGPQNTGILAGRRDLIASVALQQLDLDEHFEVWDPPAILIPKEELPGLPRHGVGRGFKVSKEAIVGLLTALKLFTQKRCARDATRLAVFLEQISAALGGLQGVQLKMRVSQDPQLFPLLDITTDPTELGRDAFALVRELRNGDPPVYVGETFLSENILVVHPLNLNEERVAVLIRRLQDVLNKTH